MYEQGLNCNGEPLRGVYVKHDPCGIDCSADGRTRQEFADECDINKLMATYERNGTLNHYNAMQGEYLDISEVPDLQEALAIMKRGESAFMSLPATVRREFDNDAVKFVEFAQDPANIDKLREWKLAAPLPLEPPPQKVEIVNPGAPGASVAAP